MTSTLISRKKAHEAAKINTYLEKPHKKILLKPVSYKLSGFSFLGVNKMNIELEYPNSNAALHLAHRAWVPDYKNPYYVTFTFANDVSEQYARRKYSNVIHSLSKRMIRNAWKRYRKLIPQHAYLEYGAGNGGYHVHSLIDVYERWDSRFKTLVRALWPHGTIKNIKIPVCDIAKVQDYDAKEITKQTASGYYSDSFLIVAP